MGRSKRVWRAALIGCGRMGSDFADDAARIGVYTHAGAYAACPDTRLVAVCDADAARAARCAARWHVPDSFTDVGRMLDTARPELVSICTPDETHAGMLLQVLAADGVRGILMEKPLALSGQDAARLVRLAERRGVTLAVNYSRRYAPGHQRLAALVQAGRIGRLQAVTGCYGKGTLHNGTHWFDLLRWFAGEVVQAQGWAGPDALTHSARLTLASGAVACLQATDARSFTVFEMDLLGTCGRIRISESGYRVERWRAGPSPRYAGYRELLPAPTAASDLRDVTLHAVRDLVRCVVRGTPPRCTGRDALAAIRIGEAIIQSAARKRPVAVRT